jgi:hypothetical protein
VAKSGEFMRSFHSITRYYQNCIAIAIQQALSGSSHRQPKRQAGFGQTPDFETQTAWKERGMNREIPCNWQLHIRLGAVREPLQHIAEAQ